MFFNDYLDGVDTLNWILNQSWCNGKIATVGLSALTINSFFIAGMNPDGLVTQSLMVGTPDVYDTAFQGGALRESMLIGWLKETVDNYDYQITQYREHLKKDNFYAPVSLFLEDGPNIQNINIPAIHVGGWYDCFQQNTLNGYIGYNTLGQVGARGKQLLIIGPFTHGFPGEGKHGQVIFPSKSISAFDLYLKWEQKLFSHIFYGREFDWKENRVAYYMMGDMNDSSEGINDYRYANEWPIEPYANDSWYLTANMGLSKDSPGSINTNVSFIFDPTNPVPTLGGTNLMIPSGPYDQSSIENRTDVLIFETSRLSEKIEVIGHMFARLWVMSNCTNTDFTVKITDVYPDGKSMLVSDGIINAIKRDGYDKDAAPLNTASPIPLTIDLWSTAYQFNIGHRIRVAISSSNYPRFAINPNTGAPQEIYSYQYLDRFIANNTILIGPDFPSAIILPRLLET
jgi:putative CocE/NonD family hydrolase